MDFLKNIMTKIKIYLFTLFTFLCALIQVRPPQTEMKKDMPVFRSASEIRTKGNVTNTFRDK